MKAIRHVAWWALLAIGLIGAIAPTPRMERVHPHTQVIQPATPQESKACEVLRFIGALEPCNLEDQR